MKKAEITIKALEGDEKSASVIMEGELLLHNVEEARLILLAAFDKYNSFNMQIINVLNIDLSFVQLVYSFHKSCSSAEKQVTYHFDLPDELKTLIESAGFKLDEIG